MFNTQVTLEQFLTSIAQTGQLLGVSFVGGVLIGLPLGILLVATRPGGITPNKAVYNIANPVVNIVRSVPFIILMVAIIPFTRLIVGTSIGTTAAIVPLILYIGPFIARLVENSLLEVDRGIVEAAESMGASPFQIIWRFLLPEATSSLILSMTTAIIGLLGATAMAGVVGGGGIGDLAIVFGYQRFDTFVMVVTVAILVIFVQGMQSFGNFAARRVRRD
ncbi:methionine ABC transporter permease [Lysinibacter cavernae]|uniref:D-methionine transport system permease protein n=1 Tax=Lysinibacter cavernae TaxID=1640652 RepID=A0A7X5R3D2_9MICO|nr:methionine ABC transporter permease [Lysinibacter cavernae]NIH54929.1 D-methionine transport system permease protein [Lysinibacter cavernae]